MNNINTQTLGIQIETRIKVEKKIIRLINSMHYLLNYVFIVFEEGSYRLVVNRCGEIITDENYKTVKGAKIAFLKFHGIFAVMDKVSAKWSHAYPADKKWLEEKLQLKLNGEMEEGGMDE